MKIEEFKRVLDELGALCEKQRWTMNTRYQPKTYPESLGPWISRLTSGDGDLVGYLTQGGGGWGILSGYGYTQFESECSLVMDCVAVKTLKLWNGPIILFKMDWPSAT